MQWPAYGPPQKEDNLEGNQEIPADVNEYRIEVTKASDQGPIVEVRDLLRRLYGEVDECGTPNPYIARYQRLKGSALPKSGDDHKADYFLGVVDYRYWPSLKLGYIENVRVSSSMRRKGLGRNLVDFAVGYMHSKGVQRIYSFAVNPEGYGLLAGAGFEPEPTDDTERPWRRWFYSPQVTCSSPDLT